MSHVDTIRRTLEELHQRDIREDEMQIVAHSALDALDALAAESQQQAETIQRLASEAEDMVLAAAYYEMRSLRDAAAAENQQLRDALEQIAHGYDGDEFQDPVDACERHIDIARAALDGTQNGHPDRNPEAEQTTKGSGSSSVA